MIQGITENQTALKTAKPPAYLKTLPADPKTLPVYLNTLPDTLPAHPKTLPAYQYFGTSSIVYAYNTVYAETVIICNQDDAVECVLAKQHK